MPSVLVPHQAPRGHMPAIIGSAVVALALPVFLIAGWRLGAWLLAALLWLAGQALALVLARLPLGMGNLATSGAVGFGRMFRAVGVMAILIAVTVSNSSLGLPAAAVYAFAYTVELGSSLVLYYGGEART